MILTFCWSLRVTSLCPYVGFKKWPQVGGAPGKSLYDTSLADVDHHTLRCCSKSCFCYSYLLFLMKHGTRFTTVKYSGTSLGNLWNFKPQNLFWKPIWTCQLILNLVRLQYCSSFLQARLCRWCRLSLSLSSEQELLNLPKVDKAMNVSSKGTSYCRNIPVH